MLVRSTLYAATLVLFMASPLMAQDAPSPEVKTGLEFGGTLGYGLPLGDAAKDDPMADTFTGKVPLILDAGYRINENIYAGAYFQYGFAMLADDLCVAEADCSGSVVRYGIEGQYHFMPSEQWDPWAGIGIGMESANINLQLGAEEADLSISGLEFLHLTGGADYRISENLAIGPVITLTVSQYSDTEISANGATLSEVIDEKTIHEWLILGVRGRFNL